MFDRYTLYELGRAGVSFHDDAQLSRYNELRSSTIDGLSGLFSVGFAVTCVVVHVYKYIIRPSVQKLLGICNGRRSKAPKLLCKVQPEMLEERDVTARCHRSRVQWRR